MIIITVFLTLKKLYCLSPLAAICLFSYFFIPLSTDMDTVFSSVLPLLVLLSAFLLMLSSLYKLPLPIEVGLNILLILLKKLLILQNIFLFLSFYLFFLGLKKFSKLFSILSLCAFIFSLSGFFISSTLNAFSNIFFISCGFAEKFL